MTDKEKILFPYPKIRKIQDEMIEEVISCIKNKKNLIVHAPTGIGKTISALGPALSFAFEKNKTVFFLTSRHTQHHIVINTLKQIKEKYGKEIISCDIIGKQWMCGQPGADALYSNEFSEYCKKVREDDECEFYLNAKKKNKVSVKAKAVLEDLKKISPCHSEDIIKICLDEKLCPYEISVLLAKEARIIVADYYYVFHPSIRESFFQKIGKELEESILIIDEGHNLPKRCRDLLTAKLSNFMVERAIKEARKFGYKETEEFLAGIKEILAGIYNGLGESEEEKLVGKEEFARKVNEIIDYEQLVNDLEFIADEIREKQKQSYIGSVANFLDKWRGEDEGFSRIFSVMEGRQPLLTLSYRCLDPSLVTKEIIEAAYCSVLMSGTLTPTLMYKDILGFDNAVEKEYDSPFPKKNRLSLIVPETTTKFTRRNEGEYRKIADKCSELVDLIPGNCALFFPSYFVRDSVYKFLYEKLKKHIVLEKQRLSKLEKQQLLEEFKSHKDKGAVLLGVASGSFGEGIDLPGDLLKAVIVVGLPLEKPSLEVRELIGYYDKLFSKGWDYGYIFPAIIKTLQNAGRCIRSEEDRGVIVFLDERYAWPNYKRCFPPDMDVKIIKEYGKEIKGFFGQ